MIASIAVICLMIADRRSEPPPPGSTDPRGADLDRAQVEAALAELVGPAPATLGPTLGLMSPRPIGVFDEVLFDRLKALGDRLHVQIIEREDRTWIMFPGGERTSRTIDELLESRWGAPTPDGDCSLWIDRVHQWQLSRCIGNELASKEVTLEWTRFLTPEQWVGMRGPLLGVEPFRLLGATRTRVEQLLGDHQQTGGWYAPAIGPGVSRSSFVELGWRDRIERWSTSADVDDPARVMRLLRAKYGKPIDAYDSDPAWGYATWNIDGQHIKATFNSYGVKLEVEDPSTPRSGAFDHLR